MPGLKQAKKIFPKALLVLVLVGVLLSPLNLIHAAGNCDSTKEICNPLKAKNIYCFVKDLMDIVTKIGFVVVVFFIIYSGFLFVTARGNEKKLEDAKNAFMYTIIGAALVLGAWVLANAVAGTIAKITGGTAPTATACQ